MLKYCYSISTNVLHYKPDIVTLVVPFNHISIPLLSIRYRIPFTITPLHRHQNPTRLPAPLLPSSLAWYSSNPTHHRYDPATDTWTQVACLSVGCDSAGVSPLGGRLLVVGGYDGQTYLDKVHAYDPHTNEWNQVRGDNYYYDVQYMCAVCWYCI